MALIIAIPIFGFLVLAQTTIISRIQLLHGTTDIVLLVIVAWALQKRVDTAWHWCIIGGLMVDIASGLPMGVPLLGYGISTGLALLLRQRVWQVPVLAMFVITFFATFFSLSISLLSLLLIGNPLPMGEAFGQVILPSVILNLLFAIPIFTLTGDLANLLYPETLEV